MCVIFLSIAVLYWCCPVGCRISSCSSSGWAPAPLPPPPPPSWRSGHWQCRPTPWPCCWRSCCYGNSGSGRARWCGQEQTPPSWPCGRASLPPSRQPSSTLTTAPSSLKVAFSIQCHFKGSFSAFSATLNVSFSIHWHFKDNCLLSVPLWWSVFCSFLLSVPLWKSVLPFTAALVSLLL